MRRTRLAVVAALLLCTGSLLAFDAVGTLLKVDADKSVVTIRVGNQERIVPVAKDAKVLGADGKELPGGLRAASLPGAEVTVTVERGDRGPTIQAIRLGRRPAAEPPSTGKSSVGFKPLTEMTAEDRYKGEDGGLYGGGRNEPPEAHQAAARKVTAQIVPRDAEGKPSPEGRIVLVSLSMSNATQEFSVFKSMADADPERSPRLTIVDCAQGGQAMAQWADPKGKPWAEAERRLAAARVTPRQVQVAWVKLANVAPSGDLHEHGKRLQRDTLAMLQHARVRFPHLQIAYLSSRIYGGYAVGRLNPEPYAYEGAFPTRWLIRDQIQGNPALNYDPARGDVQAPLLLWGPYLWADGITPRKSDGLTWERSDLVGDGVHPSPSGRRKVAEQLLKFFKTDANTRTWFVKQ